eukprot:CAMPEP_0171457006 /NCGR_PEP_ID=MMETSP0945-20130129/3261_1 /TAXON_ID=109269 /ORGANISM="Vaucheria litorea, Strain CCMP2940" /LENGTH=75 /DNA_ID=CAMNT_0011982535 /DNA_START=76 /DNA_END=300 /DNA_ORIENTATION=+
MSMVAKPFAGFGANAAKLVRTDAGKAFIVAGGLSALGLGLSLWASVDENGLKESVYAGRYFSKYRKYHKEQAEAN